MFFMYNHKCVSEFVNSVFLLFLPVRADDVEVERRSEKGLLVPVCKLLCDLGWY